MKRTTLGAIALGIGGAAVAGYGAAIGRDAWSQTKKSGFGLVLLALMACVVALPFLGGRNLCRGYPDDKPNESQNGAVLIILGFMAGFVLLSFGSSNDNSRTGDYILLSGVVAVSAAGGMLFGLGQRQARLRTFAIAERNEAFLDRLGFSETREAEITHYDGEGHPLRLMERTDDAIVFFAVGRRNKRSYMQLSEDGEMLGYTGVISLDEPRVYRTLDDGQLRTA